MPDLTLFSTIAAASASFVAIIGGLIASKLIAINGEREATKTQIHNLDEIIAIKTNEEKILQQQLNEDDALEYIIDHLAYIQESAFLEEVYEKDEPQQLEFDVLKDYWEMAVTLYKEFNKIWKKNGEVNSDGIPVELATKWSNNDFMYSLCKKFTYANDGTTWALHQNPQVITSNVNWYNEKSKEHSAILRELDVLKLQREQLERKKLSLVHPSKMGWGLGIFTGIIVFCILLPLILMRLVPVFPEIEDCAATICIILAGAGLVTTIIYMYCLLHWKPDATEVKNDNK